MKLSIVIVSYNTKDLLAECIDSIKKTTKTQHEVIIVDNASDDGTANEIDKQKAKITNLKLIQNKTNEGFSKANNRGVEKALGEYILFLNPDMVMRKGSIDGMVEYMQKNPEVGASTCFVELPSGQLDDAAHRGFPTPGRALAHFTGMAKLFPRSEIFAGYSLGYKDLTTTHEIDALAGAFMLVPRKAGEEVGWWDEDYFWYGEDLDFCYKLKERGWKVMFVPTFKVLHYKGASGGIKKSTQKMTTATRETKKKSQEARFNAMRIFYDKHYKNKYPKAVTSLVMGGITLKEFITKKVNGL